MDKRRIVSILLIISTLVYLIIPTRTYAAEKIVAENTRTIADGVYSIKSKINTKFGLDVLGASKDNGANIQLYEYTNDPQKHFKITYLDDGYYSIIATHSNKAIDVKDASKNKGANVWQYESNNTDAQKWIIKEAGNGYYSFVSKCNGLYIDVHNANASNGTNIQMCDGNGLDAQKFKLEEVKNSNKDAKNETSSTPKPTTTIVSGEKTINDGIYSIKSKLNTKYGIDVLGASKDNGANVQLYEYTNDLQKQFKVTYLNDGFYSIVAMHSNKSIDVKDASKKKGANVWQYESNNTDAQKWIIKDVGGGYYSIISKCNGLYMDVFNASASNGTNIQMCDGNGLDAQKFKFEEIVNNTSKDNNKQTPNKNSSSSSIVVSGTKTINNGIYSIKTKLNTKYGLNVVGGSKDNGANIELCEYTNTLQKQFKITYLDDGYYSIIVMHSKKAVDVKDASRNVGANVWQYEANNTDAQKWVIKDEGNGYYSIISKCNGLYMDVHNASISNGTNIQMCDGNGLDAQRFKFEEIDLIDDEYKTIQDGTYEIHSTINSNFVLDVAGASKDNGANIQLYKRARANQQRFNVKYLGEGLYTISALHSKKALDVQYASNEIGANVWQYESNGTDAQKWYIKEEGNERYSIISKCNGLYLDVHNANASNGTNIQMCNSNGLNAQRFTFSEVTNSVEINNSSNYPGYLEKIQNLKEAHPNWNFEFVYTGLTFDEAVSGEYSIRKRNLVPKSYGAYSNWVADDDKTLYDTGWYPASRTAIAYQMDPRNFLDSTNIFQFKDVNEFNADAVSIGKLNDRVSGTFLSGYGSDIYYASRNTNVDPYYIVARMIQEGGGSTLKMVRSEGTYYNPFNIGASGDGIDNVINNAYNSAKSRGWNTMQKAIEGGIAFLKSNYLESYQNTLYTNKFDIDKRHGGSLYAHQYMQNLFAAQNEALNLKSYYDKEGTIDSAFTFIIPLYENMGTSSSSHPTITGSTICNYSAVIKTNDGNGCYIRSGPGTSYGALGAYADGTNLVVIDNRTYLNTNGYDWYKVVLPSGQQGYIPSRFLR